MSAIRQAVVLCGGRGTRLAPLLGGLPKVLAPLEGRPLLAHLLQDLADGGVTEVLLLAGTGGEQVREAAPQLAPSGLAVHTEVEPAPRGTAGALWGVAARLAPRFFLVLGDLYTALDWKRLGEASESRGALATLVVHRSSHPEDSDLLTHDDEDRIIGWLGRTPERRQVAVVPAAGLGNAGVAVCDRAILERVPQGRACDLFGEVIPALVDARAPLFAYRTSEYVRDMGTPERFSAVELDVRSGRARHRAGAVLLDRDGVLTEELGGLRRAEALRLLPGAASAVHRLNEAGIWVGVVTNQAAVARGRCSMEELTRMHSHLREALTAERAHLDGLFVCPHHPETHHGEGIPEMRGPCRCRKPSVGLVSEALQTFGVQPWRAVVVGDATVDLQLASNAGLASIGLSTGLGCADGRFPARPVWRFPDLQAAAAWLCGARTPMAQEPVLFPPGGST